MNVYNVIDNQIDLQTAKQIQFDTIASKLDSNELLVENSVERKNYTLSSEFFTGSKRTIVNAINATYRDVAVAKNKSEDAASLVKNTVGDIEELATYEKFNKLKEATNSEDLIGILYEFTNENLNEAETDIINWEN